MRRCSNLLAIPFLLAAFAYGQTSPAPPAPVTAPVHVAPTVSETQPPLDVDRDPIVSPDPADNLPVSPAHPNPGQAIHRNHGIYTLRRNVDEVVLNCTVVDNHGHLVNDLTQNDFQVFENNAPQTIVSFQHSDLPVSIGILIDNSGSMRDKRAAVVTAALDLVRASNPGDEAFIVNFSDEAFLDQDFTSSIAKLSQGLAHIQAAGGTALYDAVVASANHLAEGARHPKQVLLIITDGEDDASSLNLEQTIHRVQDLQGPVVYSIGLLFGNDNTAGEVRRARRALELLSDETGGLAFFPRSLSDVDSVAAEVARDIRNQYTIGYHSTIPMSLGGYRIVRVEARAPHHGKLFVRTRAGYYPKAESAPAQKTAAVSAAQRDIGNPVQ
ncbi:MAG TPA: VWA domain-containing protein [Acidobacteriaceae bacterium]|nr:VWA domain-containing protein [Acidobacteriaceae bacterium]